MDDPDLNPIDEAAGDASGGDASGGDASEAVVSEAVASGDAAPEPATTPPPVPPAAQPLDSGSVVSFVEAPEDAIARAAAELRAGGLVVIPTDTVYGIAANAFDRNATARIFEVKRRPRSLPLPVLVSRPRQAWALCAEVPPVATELAAAFWPGALTLVLPSTDGLDWDLGDANGTIAVRMPSNRLLIDLLERVGPVACTSANLTGEPTPPTIEEIRDKLGTDVGIYVDGGHAASDTGSTIVDCTGPEPSIIRAGPISAIQIRAVASRAT